MKRFIKAAIVGMALAYQREVVTLPLASTVKHKLLLYGYRDVSDLENRSTQELIHKRRLAFGDVGLRASEAVEVLKVVSPTPLVPRSGLELATEERGIGKIVTLCRELDGVLAGGVPLSRVTEFCGGPGIGKTQIGSALLCSSVSYSGMFRMQLCVNAAIPVESGGLGSASVYIDTEGSFSVDRVSEIAEGMIRHFQSASQPTAGDLTLDHVLAGIHYFRVNSYLEQVALFETLPEFLQGHPSVRLIVVDSISVHFRQGFEDMSQRTRLLNRLAQNMMALAESNKIAVVYMNQVTRRFYENNESETIPVLGDSWGQCVNTQVRLYWDGEVRNAGVYKAPHLERKAVPYQITTDGVRSP